MEMKFDFDILCFCELPRTSKNDLIIRIDKITIYDKNFIPPTIEIEKIKKMGNNTTIFLIIKKKTDMSPKIYLFGKGLIYIYPPIEKIKNKIK